ncbi:MAG: VOC family protein [Myxococcota bacterium]
MDIHLYAVRVFVSDLEEGRDFYGRILGLPEKWASSDAAGYDVGVTLIVEQDDGEHDGLAGRFVGCSFEVNDLDRTVAEWSDKGVTFQGPPEKQPWGGRLVHFEDPSGNVLTLTADP